MRWLAPFVALASTGCFVFDCPRGASYCEGDVLTFCRSTCTGDSKTNRSCSPTVTTQDCAAQKKTCRDLTYEDGKWAACLDAPLKACPPASAGGRVAVPMTCLPSGRVVYCATSGTEAFEDTRDCERSDLVCNLTPTGMSCIDAARTPCDPAVFQRCEAGRYQQYCHPNSDGGSFLRTNDCGAGRLCKQDADSGITFCADR